MKESTSLDHWEAEVKLEAVWDARMIPGGLFLYEEVSEKVDAGDSHALGIESYDPVNKEFITNGYQSDGSRYSGALTITGNTVIWAGPLEVGGKHYQFRETFIPGKRERSGDCPLERRFFHPGSQTERSLILDEETWHYSFVLATRPNSRRELEYATGVACRRPLLSLLEPSKIKRKPRQCALSNNRKVLRDPSSKTEFRLITGVTHLRTSHRGQMSVHIPSTNQCRVINFPQRQRIAINGFCRVTKYRPCRVCRKPDWCGYSTDEQTTICMRISNGSKGTSRNGGNIFHHNRLFLVASARTNRKQAPPPIEIAPIEIRNAVYKELIRRSPALKYYSQLIDGPGGLLSRGLREAAMQTYGALPRTQKERVSLARTLNKFVSVRFPEYEHRSTRVPLIGVPGFYQDEAGNIQLWGPHDYNMPLLVIPYRDEQNRIQACQLRLHRSDLHTAEKKYRWLACPFPFRGTSSGTPIHCTFKPAGLPPGNTVIVTEGALKGDVLVSLRPKARVIATSGVSCSHAEIIHTARPYNALIAFDADYKTNPAVALQLARLIAAREQDIVAHHLKTTTRIVTWQKYKGIDDAILADISLETMSILQWISRLDGRPLQEVLRVWKQMGFTPTSSPVKKIEALAE